jgi:hypothetical protein
MTMAAEAKLFANVSSTGLAGAKLFANVSSTGHQAISDERHKREKWQLKVGPSYWGRYNSPFI